MLKIICVFFPAVLSVWMFEALTKQQLGLKSWAYRFCLNTIICNAFVFAVKVFVTQTSRELLNQVNADMVPDVALRYIIMAVPAAAVAAVIEALLTKKIGVCISEDEDDKTE